MSNRCSRTFPQATANAEKLLMLRDLLAGAERRAANPEAFAISLAKAREDGAMIAARVVAILTEGIVSDGVPPAVEELAEAVLTGFIGERADALRAAGATDNEVLAYALGTTIAAAEAIERAKAQVRSVVLH